MTAFANESPVPAPVQKKTNSKSKVPEEITDHRPRTISLSVSDDQMSFQLTDTVANMIAKSSIRIDVIDAAHKTVDSLTVSISEIVWPTQSQTVSL